MLLELVGHHQVGLQGGFEDRLVVAALGQVGQVGANAAAFGSKAMAGHAESGGEHLLAVGEAPSHKGFLL